MRAEVYICDICSVRKEESNHWLFVVADFEGIRFYPWINADADEPELKHLCGIGCANKLLSQTVEGWSVVKEEK